MRRRDRVVLAVLAAGVVVALVAWDVLGPWWALGLALAALLGAGAVYRVDAAAAPSTDRAPEATTPPPKRQ